MAQITPEYLTQLDKIYNELYNAPIGKSIIGPEPVTPPTGELRSLAPQVNLRQEAAKVSGLPKDTAEGLFGVDGPGLVDFIPGAGFGFELSDFLDTRERVRTGEAGPVEYAAGLATTGASAIVPPALLKVLKTTGKKAAQLADETWQTWRPSDYPFPRFENIPPHAQVKMEEMLAIKPTKKDLDDPLKQYEENINELQDVSKTLPTAKEVDQQMIPLDRNTAQYSDYLEWMMERNRRLNPITPQRSGLTPYVELPEELRRPVRFDPSINPEQANKIREWAGEDRPIIWFHGTRARLPLEFGESPKNIVDLVTRNTKAPDIKYNYIVTDVYPEDAVKFLKDRKGAFVDDVMYLSGKQIKESINKKTIRDPNNIKEQFNDNDYYMVPGYGVSKATSPFKAFDESRAGGPKLPHAGLKNFKVHDMIGLHAGTENQAANFAAEHGYRMPLVIKQGTPILEALKQIGQDYKINVNRYLTPGKETFVESALMKEQANINGFLTERGFQKFLNDLGNKLKNNEFPTQKHGFTQELAERIRDTLEQYGVTHIPYINEVEDVGDVSVWILRPEYTRNPWARFEPNTFSPDPLAGVGGIALPGLMNNEQQNRIPNE